MSVDEPFVTTPQHLDVLVPRMAAQLMEDGVFHFFSRDSQATDTKGEVEVPVSHIKEKISKVHVNILTLFGQVIIRQIPGRGADSETKRGDPVSMRC